MSEVCESVHEWRGDPTAHPHSTVSQAPLRARSCATRFLQSFLELSILPACHQLSLFFGFFVVLELSVLLKVCVVPSPIFGDHFCGIIKFATMSKKMMYFICWFLLLKTNFLDEVRLNVESLLK